MQVCYEGPRMQEHNIFYNNLLDNKRNPFKNLKEKNGQVPVWNVLMSLEVPVLLREAIVNNINLLQWLHLIS